jgi:hypothetical protein
MTRAIKKAEIIKSLYESAKVLSLSEDTQNLLPRARCHANPWNCRFKEFGEEISGWGQCLTHEIVWN